MQTRWMPTELDMASRFLLFSFLVHRHFEGYHHQKQVYLKWLNVAKGHRGTCICILYFECELSGNVVVFYPGPGPVHNIYLSLCKVFELFPLTRY